MGEFQPTLLELMANGVEPWLKEVTVPKPLEMLPFRTLYKAWISHGKPRISPVTFGRALSLAIGNIGRESVIKVRTSDGNAVCGLALLQTRHDPS